MSRPRWQVPLVWCWNRGLRRGTTSSGSSAMRERRQIKGASVAHRAAMNGGSMSRPAGKCRRCGVGTGVCEEGRHHRVQARCASAGKSMQE